LSDQVLRHLAVRADLELKRAAKSAARQREKAARRPPRLPSPMPPAAPAPAQEAIDTGRQFRTEKGEPS
ncbi:MAG TPA: hypothetical protein VGB47_08790, partial [Thermoanaerobaculia bacterium]